MSFSLDSVDPDKLLIFLQKVSKYLSIKNLCALRCVSKKIETIIRIIKIEELIFSGNYNHKDRWILSNKLINHPASDGNLNSSFLWYFSWNRFNNSSVKRIKFYDFKESLAPNSQKGPCKLGQIKNFFPGLEHLEIRITSFLKYESISLCFPNLRKLSFEIKNTRSLERLAKRFCIEIQSPFLNSLHTNVHFDILKIRFTKEVKFLSVWEYDMVSDYSKLMHLENANEFTNLEVLHLRSIAGFVQNPLEDFSKIQEIHLEERNTNILERLLETVFEKKKENLKIFYLGVEITNQDLSVYGDLKGIEAQEIQANNYPLVKNDLFFMEEINLTKYMNHLIIPNDFLLKYNNIKKLIVDNKIKDIDSFTDFVKECLCLNVLILKDSGLTQTFFDTLANKDIIELSIWEFEDRVLYFDFVFKMRYLQVCRLDHQFRIKNPQALRNTVNLHQMLFEVHRCYYCFLRLPNDTFDFSCLSECFKRKGIQNENIKDILSSIYKGTIPCSKLNCLVNKCISFKSY